jgi:hypothetical protein
MASRGTNVLLNRMLGFSDSDPWEEEKEQEKEQEKGKEPLISESHPPSSRAPLFPDQRPIYPDTWKGPLIETEEAAEQEEEKEGDKEKEKEEVMKEEEENSELKKEEEEEDPEDEEEEEEEEEKEDYEFSDYYKRFPPQCAKCITYGILPGCKKCRFREREREYAREYDAGLEAEKEVGACPDPYDPYNDPESHPPFMARKRIAQEISDNDEEKGKGGEEEKEKEKDLKGMQEALARIRARIDSREEMIDFAPEEYLNKGQYEVADLEKRKRALEVEIREEKKRKRDESRCDPEGWRQRTKAGKVVGLQCKGSNVVPL